MESKYRFCQECKAPCSRDLGADPKKSGVVIYVHKRRDSLKWSTEQCSRSDDAFILQNTSYDDLKKSEYTGETRQYQAKCFQCKRLVHRVRSLLDELTEIRENPILGICEHCKRSKSTKKCPRCDYIIKKFLAAKVRQCDERVGRFKVWLCRVRHLLQAILDGGNVCQHAIYPDSNLELKNLLQLLKAPLTIHEPTSEFFPIEKDLASLQNLTESKEIIDELILKLQTEQPDEHYSFDDSVYASPSKMCICKYFMDKKFDGVLPEMDFGYKPEKDREGDTTSSAGHRLQRKSGTDKTHKSRDTISHLEKSKSGRKEKSLSSGEKSPRTSSKKSDKGKAPNSDKDLTILKSLKERKLLKKGTRRRSASLNEEEKLLLKLLQDFKKQKHDKQVGTPTKHAKGKGTTRLADLPTIKTKSHKSSKSLVSATDSESFMECGDRVKEPSEMIKDIKIVPYDHNYKREKGFSRVPLLFNIYSPDFACPSPEPPTPSPTVVADDISSVVRAKSAVSAALLRSKGAFSYTLSNRDFIDNGVTKLPTEKIMRKMNIYRMEPTHPNWFERNKSMNKYYNTGELLAEINEDGSGKWFYKKGVVALDYHYTVGPNSSPRYVIYSAGKDLKTGRFKPQTVLASFDLHGNGVVYDHVGNIRLKYNQSEGIIVDEKLGPPGKWKWHTLNDPPVLQRLYINTNLKCRDPVLELLHDLQQKEPTEMLKRKQEQEALMLTIELDNYVKEKATKLLQKFKPLEIRMKAIKINEQFSLKVLQQANIRLYFRDAATSLKLNMGLSLISDEIIDTDTAEVSEVATPYDKRPPKTTSVADIQRMIDRVRIKDKQLRGSAS